MRVNTLRPRQNCCHFSDDTFKRIFVNENIWILITISLKFVRNGNINNIPALVQITAWRRYGGEPLFEQMLVRLSTHIWVTRAQWFNVKETHFDLHRISILFNIADDTLKHDDVIKWKHFPRCWSFVRRIHRSPVHFPHKGQIKAVTQSFDVFYDPRLNKR